jgi:MFS family permease
MTSVNSMIPRTSPPRLESGPGADADRLAITVTFMLSGFVFASWAVRIPDVSAQVGASHAALGAALLCVSLGALATMRLTGWLCERFGSGPVSTSAAALLSSTVVVPGLVTSIGALSAALLIFGAATGMLNVAMNSMGVQLEKVSGRPVLSSMHAAFSFGGLAGSVVGGLVGSRMPVGAHLVAVAVGGLLTTSMLSPSLRALATRDRSAFMEPSADTRGGGGGVRGVVLALGAIAACTAYGEGALSDWAGLHLTVDLHSTTIVAAAGYAVFSLAMAVGRLLGHRLLAALWATRLLASGATAAAAGMLLTALSPHVGPALAGLVVVGLGLANLFPVAIARAGALAGPRGVGLASTVGYSGLLAGPALIGFLSARLGLPVALTSVSALALVAAALAVLVDTAPSQRVRGEMSTQLRDRLVTWCTPLAGGIAVAMQDQMVELRRLDPATGAGRAPGRPMSGLNGSASFLDLEELLGTARARS